MTIQDILPGHTRAHELYGDFWFNGEPVSVAGHRGEVFLIDFWDYTSVESSRTIPYMREWHRKYAPSQLLVVGVHSPRFRFGRDPERVQTALAKLGIEYPVVMDNDHLVWTSYGNRVWPTKHLVDRNGFVRYRGIGEGSYLALEHAIQNLLSDASRMHDFPDLMAPLRDTDNPDAVLFRGTPEVFAGYLRGSIGNIEGYSPESVVDYTDPELYVDGRIYLNGLWMNERDCLRWSGDTGTGHMVFPYAGSELYAVLESPRGQSVMLEVLHDGLPLTDDNKGDDVVIDQRGISTVTVRDPRLYLLVKNPEHGNHTLKLIPRGPRIGVYAFSCVSSVIPEVIAGLER
jgi:hypothetical protein